MRFSAAARRVLHATAEVRTARRLKEAAAGGAAEQLLAAPSHGPPSAEPLLPGVARVLVGHGAAPDRAAAVAMALERVCSALESLLEIGACVTVSAGHVAAALQTVQLVAVANVLAPTGAVVALEKAVRGRLPDRRFHGDALRVVALSLLAAATTGA